MLPPLPRQAMHSITCSGSTVHPHVCLTSANAGLATNISQHTVRWPMLATSQHAEFTAELKWNTAQDRQVHYTDAAVGHQVTVGGLQLSVAAASFAIIMTSL